MSSSGGSTTPATAGRRRAVAWAAVAVTLVVATTSVTVALSSPSSPASAGTRAPTGQAAAADAARSAVAPPPTALRIAPGHEVTAGVDQSDPFLTTADGRYLLVTSGGTGPHPVNVPLVTSTDFVHWTAPVDALPSLPGWAVPGFTWAPDLHRFGTRWALYFTAMLAGYSPQTQCIGSAFADSPTGPFTADPTPFICQLSLGGSIDPRVFVDSDGAPWMVWKSDQNIGGSATPTQMWSQPLATDGSRLLDSPSFLLSPDEPWQGSIVEAPDMVEVDGAYWVVYSANWYNSPAYGVGAARCAGPAGPCQDTGPAPLLATNFQGEGPGEASVFHDAAGIWMLYSPRRSLAPKPDVPARPVYITRLGVTRSGPYLASGALPDAADLLAVPVWSAFS